MTDSEYIEFLENKFKTLGKIMAKREVPVEVGKVVFETLQQIVFRNGNKNLLK